MTTKDPAVNTVNYSEQGGARWVVGGEIDIVSGGALKVNGADVTSSVAGSGVAGVASGYKLARGQATTSTASDTVVTGLSTVVAAVASLDDAPVVGCESASASIGDQAGTPAAGSILIQTWKTLSGTPAQATTTGKKVNWIAFGY